MRLCDENAEAIKQKDAAVSEALELRKKIAELETQLARSDERAEAFDEEVVAPLVMRVELPSRVPRKENEKVSALARLPEPEITKRGSGGIGLVVPQDTKDEIEMRVVSLPVVKSPSESYLTGLQPDLDSDSSDDEIDLKVLEATRMKLEKRLWRNDVPAMDLGAAAIRADRKGLALITQLGFMEEKGTMMYTGESFEDKGTHMNGIKVLRIKGNQNAVGSKGRL